MLKKNKEDIDTKGLNDVIKLSNKILKLFYAVLIIGMIFVILKIMKEIGLTKLLLGVLKVISPLFIGFIIAWLFNPLVCKLKDKGLPKVVSALIVYLIFLILAFLFIRVFIPVVYSQLNDLLKVLPSIFTEVTDKVNSLSRNIVLEGIDISSVKESIIDTIETSLYDFTESLPTVILNFVINLFSGLGIVLVSLVVGLYMLFDFDAISMHFVKLIPMRHREEVRTLLNNISTEVRKTVNGTLLVATMVLVCDTIGFTIVGLESPLLFGTFCGLTDLIPYIGPYIGGAAAVIVGFTQGPIVGITVLIIVIIVQIAENYILQPVVMSKAINLHPVTIIIGLLVFGYFFGIFGMILATPCIALIKVIWQFIKEKYNLFNYECPIKEKTIEK